MKQKWRSEVVEEGEEGEVEAEEEDRKLDFRNIFLNSKILKVMV